MSATWTDDRVETLARLWKAGLSASQIARSLGGVTRNAVIGKVHRLGLSGRSAPNMPGARRAEPRRERRGRIAKPKAAAPPPTPRAAAMPEQECTETGSATIVSVGRRQCRWPLGEPLADAFRLCGRPVARGAYCAGHGALAYRPVERGHLLRLAGLR